MANQLAKSGAQPARPVRYGILWHNNFYLGIATQRNPLKSNLQHIEEEFYGTQACLIDGINCEVSPKLTLIRRPGSSVYNSQTFPPINRFYENKTATYDPTHSYTTENIQVLADTASVIYDATGPSTKNTLFTKSASLPAYFQGVGNELFFTTGVDLYKYLTPQYTWSAGATFTVGDYIVDSNGNIQSFQSQAATMNITGIAVVSAAPTDLSDAQTFLIVTLASPPPVLQPCQPVTFAGLTTYTALNGATLLYQNISAAWGLGLSPTQIAFKYTASLVAQAPDTGTASTFIQQDQYGNPLTGLTGGSAPTWNAAQYGTTTDGTITWTCYGSLVENWQVPAPVNPPTVQPTAYNTPANASNVCNYWRPNQTVTVGSTQTTVIFDSNSNLETPAAATGSGIITTVYRPTSSSGIAGIVLNPSYAYANIPNQFAELETLIFFGTATCTWEGFSSTVLAQQGLLTVVAQITGDSGVSVAIQEIQVSLNGGSTWTTLISTTSSQPQTSYTMAVPIGTNISQVRVKATSNALGNVCLINIYDINIGVGSFTPGTSSGLTGNVEPTWNTSLGGTTKDNQVIWVNLGRASTWLASYQYPESVTVLIDSNGNLQYTNQFFQTKTIWTTGTANTTGATNTTGTIQPTWSTTLGGITTDNAYSWVCLGPATQITAGTLQYAYSYHCIDGSVSTASPVSYVLNAVAGSPGLFEIQVSVVPSTDKQVDQIWLWRTVGGGSTLFFLDTVPNVPPNGSVTYLDSLPDASLTGGQALNQFIEAPIADSSNPPPSGLKYLTYHLGRIFGAVGNTVQWSQGPDVTSGNGNTAWSPSNVFVYPDTVTRLFPTANGLIVFTVSNVFIIQGLGTANSAFFSAPFVENLGLVSYDAFAVNGIVSFLYTSDNQVVSLDLNTAISEVSFAIGDQFGPNNGTGTFLPANTQVTWHNAQSEDKALYVSDFTGTWWRGGLAPAPENGWTWNPKAQVVGGFSAVQSVEVVPGTHYLLIGPKTSGPILKRDYSVYADNGTAYNAYGIIGSLVLAQPGQLAHVPFITTDSEAVGTPLTLAVQLDEIAPLSAGYFETLSDSVADPTQLTASNSVFAQRFYLSQTQEPAVCRHMQIQFLWGTDTVKNELLSLSVYGGFSQET